MITWNMVVAIDPALSTISTEQQIAILTDVYATLSTSRWGSKLDLGAKYLAAHTGAMALRGGGLGSPGPIASEGLGDANRSYSVSVTSSFSDLDATIWGKRFQFLMRGLGFVGFVV